MSARAKVALSVAASILSVAGLAFVVGTLIHVRNLDQLHHLLTYDYMSFVDSHADGSLGSVANDFFTGVSLVLIGSVLFTKIERTSRGARIVAACLFVFAALSLVYACANLRLGIAPH
ncbi:hypothetical protein DIE03_36540 [Burkholderia sp. Bp8992]|uniref:hypothetical protein n=1 Tax=Burkholderia sp. Bp8992 TaxID=2184554 RepID=UPI000F586DC7|nr:hypothetical protein [Burkholderia sp. Bp8992]RQS17968.1 hypothetical protein DIE03_36540 [Burkholderia sp. Bp8992]